LFQSSGSALSRGTSVQFYTKSDDALNWVCAKAVKPNLRAVKTNFVIFGFKCSAMVFAAELKEKQFSKQVMI